MLPDILKKQIHKYGLQAFAVGMTLVNAGCGYETPTFLKKKVTEPIIDVGFRCDKEGRLNTQVAWFDPNKREVVIKLENISRGQIGILNSNQDRSDRAMIVASKDSTFQSSGGPMKIREGDQIKVEAIDRSNTTSNTLAAKDTVAVCSN